MKSYMCIHDVVNQSKVYMAVQLILNDDDERID